MSVYIFYASFYRGILHDPAAYPEPEKFKPERFLGQPEGQAFSPTDRLSSAFGYGRRTCPGKYVAEAQVWISIACMLSVFDIRKALDEFGRPVEVVPEFSSGMIW